MRESKLDLVEELLVSSAKRRPAPELPLGFTARVMLEVREKARPADLYTAFMRLVRPIFAVGAAAAICLAVYSFVNEDMASQYIYMTKLQDPGSPLAALRFFL